jgi:methyltransferase (TIGR00027 family)
MEKIVFVLLAILLSSCRMTSPVAQFEKGDVPVSETAWFCCGARTDFDPYAADFMTAHGRAVYQGFKDLKKPLSMVAARHRIIDERVSLALAVNSELLVVNIGAGFDSRPYRLTGGNWIEVDGTDVVRWKNERLPVEKSPNRLRRVGMEFSKETLAEKLVPFSTEGDVLVLIEGVLMYLTEEEIGETLATLKLVFPNHRLVCDLMSKGFMESYGAKLHARVEALGTTFRFRAEDPAAFVRERGYAQVESVSIATGGGIAMPGVLMKVMMPGLVKGFSVGVFEAVSGR